MCSFRRFLESLGVKNDWFCEFSSGQGAEWENVLMRKAHFPTNSNKSGILVSQNSAFHFTLLYYLSSIGFCVLSKGLNVYSYE